MGKSDANECNESSLSNCRVQLALSTKKDGMILEQISLQERRRGRKNSYNIKFKLVLLNQYPGKNTLKAILNKVVPMGERNDFRTRISRIL